MLPTFLSKINCMTAISSGTFDLVLLLILLATSLVQLYYYFWYYIRTASIKLEKKSGKKVPVSVIICARNEADNLKAFLPAVLEQDYPEFEVIVVNDCSEDNTEEVLTSLSSRYKQLHVTTIHKDSSLVHSKKMALFLGIKAASNEYLLLTDADCRPETDKWIDLMISGFRENQQFVLGYGGYPHNI